MVNPNQNIGDIREKTGELLLVLGLLCAGAYLFTYRLDQVSATIDEPEHLRNSAYVVKHRQWDQTEVIRHPPLTYYLYGWVPLLFPDQPFETQLLYSRLSRLPLYLGLALIIYWVIRRWHGRHAALIGLVLFHFNPEILAHSRLLSLDMTLMVFVLVAILTFYAFLRKPTSVRVLVAGGGLGLALLAKTPALLLVLLYAPLAILYILLYRGSVKKLGGGLVVVYAIALFLLHTGYLFRETGSLPPKWQSQKLGRLAQTPLQPILYALPRAYLAGWDELTRTSEFGWQGFLAGEYYEDGRWYFFPIVFLIKTPLPMLILIYLLVVCTIYQKVIRPPYLHVMVSLVIGTYTLYFMFLNKINIGFRYLLWIWPLVIIMLTPLVNVRFKRSRSRMLMRTIVIFLLLWYVWGTVRVAPFYLAYANELIGGPKNAWKYLADSNIDWHQDAHFFLEYQKTHPGLVVNPLTPTPGQVAVNVNVMNLSTHFEPYWLRRLGLNPIDTVGYTWLIFDVTEEEVVKIFGNEANH